MEEKPHAQLPDILFTELKHCVHDFLQIANVFALRRVSRSWHQRIGSALRRLPWHVVHSGAGVDIDAHVWLEKLAVARVRVHSVRLVSVHERAVAYSPVYFFGECVCTGLGEGIKGGERERFGDKKCVFSNLMNSVFL